MPELMEAGMSDRLGSLEDGCLRRSALLALIAKDHQR
jgi:hypothetical protein